VVNVSVTVMGKAAVALANHEPPPAFKQVRRMCRLTEEDGVDSSAFYGGSDVVDVFIDELRAPHGRRQRARQERALGDLRRRGAAGHRHPAQEGGLVPTKSKKHVLIRRGEFYPSAWDGDPASLPANVIRGLREDPLYAAATFMDRSEAFITGLAIGAAVAAARARRQTPRPGS
jgi:hypothetical protein